MTPETKDRIKCIAVLVLLMAAGLGPFGWKVYRISVEQAACDPLYFSVLENGSTICTKPLTDSAK